MNKSTKTIKTLPSCWIITEGIKGTENQCVGIAEMLGLKPTVKTVTLQEPWKSLSPYLGLERKSTFIGDDISAPYPDILITGGRKAIAASRYIKKQSNGATKTLHVLDPRISPKHFDLVTLPEHDKTRGGNVIVTKATPNRITVKTLQEGKKQFPLLGDLPSPRLAVLIGGTSKAYTFDMETAKRFVNDLKTLQTDNKASLMVTMSRRTPKEVADYIRTSLDGKNTYIWDETTPNPYFGFLAWADIILATSDSTSMLSESCTTGKSTYMIPLKETGKLGRIKKLQNNLIDHGGMRIFEGKLETWKYRPLNDSQLVANEIKKQLPDLF